LGATKPGLKEDTFRAVRRLDKYPMWADLGYEGATPLHESIHRGIQFVLDAPGNEDLKRRLKEFEDWGPNNYRHLHPDHKRLFENATTGNEYATRALMLRHYGDIEYGKGGGPATQFSGERSKRNPQIESARTKLKYRPEFVELLNDIQQRAAHMGAQRLMDR